MLCWLFATFICNIYSVVFYLQIPVLKRKLPAASSDFRTGQVDGMCKNFVYSVHKIVYAAMCVTYVPAKLNNCNIVIHWEKNCKLRITLFWDVMPCSLVEVYGRCFRQEEWQVPLKFETLLPDSTASHPGKQQFLWSSWTYKSLQICNVSHMRNVLGTLWMRYV